MLARRMAFRDLAEGGRRGILAERCQNSKQSQPSFWFEKFRRRRIFNRAVGQSRGCVLSIDRDVRARALPCPSGAPPCAQSTKDIAAITASTTSPGRPMMEFLMRFLPP